MQQNGSGKHQCPKCGGEQIVRGNEVMALLEINTKGGEPTLNPGMALATRPHVCTQCGFIELYAAANEANSPFPKIAVETEAPVRA
jgi:predicted RNA-binding Zn-ribbon protein involved in translation (DUF1610 family)